MVSKKLLSINIWVVVSITVGSIFYVKVIHNNRITVEPKVLLNNKLYTYSTINERFWAGPIYNEIMEAYGSRYSKKLQAKIIDNMMDQVEALGEDPQEFKDCLVATGELDKPNMRILPCVAEKARFEYYINHTDLLSYMVEDEGTYGEKAIDSCWIIAFIWETIPRADLSHIRYYAISSNTKTQLTWASCK